MRTQKFFSLILLFVSGQLMAQSLDLRIVMALPVKVQETSGIETNTSLSVWTHQDGGDGPYLYKVDTNGNLLRTLTIKNAVNVDWEDVAQDDQHNYYLADIGNNENNRKDLKIYKIPDPDQLSSDTVTASVISFTYSNQSAFPPPDAGKNFDAEALLYYNQSLYLFSKNRTIPFSGYTYLYKIPADAGNYTAELIDSFKTGDGMKEQWWITAADISPDQKRVALLSSDKLFVFTGFNGDKFLKGKVKQISLNSFTQKEAFVFLNEDEFYISDEYYPILGGRNLYWGTLQPIYAGKTKTPAQRGTALIAVRKQFGEQVLTLLDETKKVQVKVIDTSGRILKIFQLNSSETVAILEVPPGYYTLKVSDGRTVQEMAVVVN